MSGTVQAALYSSPNYVVYPTIVSDKDLLADDPRNVANMATSAGRPCRQIVCTGNAGDLVVTRPDGTNVTLPMLTGLALDVQAKALVASGTSATNIVVLW